MRINGRVQKVFCCDAADLLEAPKTRKNRSSLKVTKNDSRRLPQSNPKSNPESNFLTPKSHFWVTFRVKNLLSGLLLGYFGGRFRQVFVFLGPLGSCALVIVPTLVLICLKSMMLVSFLGFCGQLAVVHQRSCHPCLKNRGHNFFKPMNWKKICTCLFLS